MPTNATNQTTGSRSSSSSKTSRPASSASERPDTASKAGRATTESAGTSSRAGIQDQLRGDRERNVDIARERGTRDDQMRVSSPSTSTQSSAAYSSPFAFMRRFGEDMDRLFEDFGFAPLGLDPFALLSPAAGYGLGAPALGAGERAPSAGSQGRQLSTRGRSGAIAPSGSWLPQVEVSTRNDALVVRADLPGVKREDVQIDLDDDRLVLSGSRQQENEERGEGFYHSERSYGSFSRVIPLPKGIDADACQAKYQDGVLEITIPLPKQASTSKRIAIR
jgi:HSP20 family protein